MLCGFRFLPENGQIPGKLLSMDLQQPRAGQALVGNGRWLDLTLL